MLESFITWVHKVDNWILGALPVLGAAIAHLKEYEGSDELRPPSWHLRGFLIKLVYAVFVSLLVGQAAAYYAIGDQLTYIAVGLCSAFAKEGLDFVWRTAILIIRRRAGVHRDSVRDSGRRHSNGAVRTRDSRGNYEDC